MTSNRIHQFVAPLLVICASMAGSPPATSQTRPTDEPMHIVGGQTTSEWPAIGALTLFFPGEYGLYAVFCTGTLVGRDLVLTAAHCIQPTAPEYFITGPSYQNPTSIYAITDISMHPDYVQGEFAFDLAMLRLAGPTEETPFAVSTLIAYPGLEVFVAGYGSNDEQNHTGAGFKRYTTNEVFEIRSYHVLTTSAWHSHPAVGDSGGPMFVDPSQSGVPTVNGVINAGIKLQYPPWHLNLQHRLDLPEVLDWLATFPGVCYEGSPCDHLFVSNFE